MLSTCSSSSHVDCSGDIISLLTHSGAGEENAVIGSPSALCSSPRCALDLLHAVAAPFQSGMHADCSISNV